MKVILFIISTACLLANCEHNDKLIFSNITNHKFMIQGEDTLLEFQKNQLIVHILDHPEIAPKKLHWSMSDGAIYIDDKSSQDSIVYKFQAESSNKLKVLVEITFKDSGVTTSFIEYWLRQ